MERRFEEIALGLGRTGGGGVAVDNARVRDDLAADWGRDDAGTTGRRDQTRDDRATLASNLCGHSVRVTEHRAPVAATHGYCRELCKNDGTTDGGGNLLCALDTKTDVAVLVADNDKGLEARALSGGGLLLHGHDLHYFVLQGGQEHVDDLVLLDGQREQVDLLDGLEQALLHETAELGDGHPSLLFAASLAAVSASSASAASESSRGCSAWG